MSARTALPAVVLALLVVALMLAAVPTLRPSADSSSARASGADGATVAPVAGAIPAPAAPTPTPRASTVVAYPAAPGPSVSGWDSSDFFHDVAVGFSGTGLSGPFQPEPYVNSLPQSTLGFWLNLSAIAPILYANVTIWSEQWSTNGAPAATNGFSPAAPYIAPMQVLPAAPSHASYYFNDYRFFWPGATVWFNVTVVGSNSTPSEVNSAWNDSVPVTFPGGFVDNATWGYDVGTPWASTNFSNDIAISTSPSVLGTTTYDPNPTQSLMVSLQALDLGGTLAPIPDAELAYTVSLNGSVTTASLLFGPANHTTMSLLNPIGPYPGATVAFNVTAWLPWESGAIDKVVSPVYTFTWSPNGGWWHPLGGLTENVALALSPAIPTTTAGVAIPVLPTAAPVNITLHEPIENVSISSAEVNFAFSDDGLTHSGSVPMSSVSQNTTLGILPGLPPGGELTFYVVAKDIYGDPVSSGNYSYEELGPTAPPLPSGKGLLFTEVLDLSGGGLVPGFGYTISNATWSTSGVANGYGFALPLLPNSDVPYQLGFGAYSVTVHAFGNSQTATIVLSPSSPTPTVVFYGESHPIPIVTTGTLPAASLAAAIGLIAMAVVTLPLVRWYEERRSRAEDEQRRVSV
ncbi:MAG: hypothetical protein WA719_08485 [Thermoplasmata archaeon]